MSDMYKSEHSGKAIDQSVKDVALLKERIGKAEDYIQYLNTHKANENIVPKSIKDLEPNASLVYIGEEAPPPSYNIWFFAETNEKYIIRVLDPTGEWVDVASRTTTGDVIATVTQTENGAEISITDVNGTTTAIITNGKDGQTPVRGIDYWTDADKAEIKGYVDEAILGGAW